MHIAVLLLVILTGCSQTHRPPVPPPETFEQMLTRTEFVTCADITYHDYGDAPDCRLVYEAWVRGRNRVARIYPTAAEYKMVGISFYRPKTVFVDDRPYPLIADVPGNPRGVTYTLGGLQIVYSYEHVVEHEAVHALMFLLDGLKVREASAVSVDMGGYPPESFENIPFYFYLIGCHGTPDDPFGELGNRASCVLPYATQ
jgi:hypothetical protein